VFDTLCPFPAVLGVFFALVVVSAGGMPMQLRYNHLQDSDSRFRFKIQKEGEPVHADGPAEGLEYRIAIAKTPLRGGDFS
jgi:hypothetical protein